MDSGITLSLSGQEWHSAKVPSGTRNDAFWKWWFTTEFNDWNAGFNGIPVRPRNRKWFKHITGISSSQVNHFHTMNTGSNMLWHHETEQNMRVQLVQFNFRRSCQPFQHIPGGSAYILISFFSTCSRGRIFIKDMSDMNHKLFGPFWHWMGLSILSFGKPLLMASSNFGCGLLRNQATLQKAHVVLNLLGTQSDLALQGIPSSSGFACCSISRKKTVLLRLHLISSDTL